MIKILHSADWHLDSPIQGRTPEQTQLLQQNLLRLPQRIAAAALSQGCDLMVLSGDLFDGPASRESIHALRDALKEAAMPVFITPGNHDPLTAASPWLTESWPENIHIFKAPVMESVALPELDCRVYGAGFTGSQAAGVLDGFHCDGSEKHRIGVFHGEPMQFSSPNGVISGELVKQTGLDYLALGHIHKGDSFRAGKTLCAWPGCPMGRGFDELGEKGVLIVTLDESSAQAQFLPLDDPRFYDWECVAGSDAAASLSRLLPAVGSYDFYRVTLTGESEALDLDALLRQFDRFPNLQLRDRTVPPLDIWGSAGADSLEGVYFAMLRQQLAERPEAAQLAARISRQILEGLEVTLP